MTELRDLEREMDRFRGRLLAAAVFVLALFALLAARLVYLQVVRHEALATVLLLAPQRRPPDPDENRPL